MFDLSPSGLTYQSICLGAFEVDLEESWLVVLISSALLDFSYFLNL